MQLIALVKIMGLVCEKLTYLLTGRRAINLFSTGLLTKVLKYFCSFLI